MRARVAPELDAVMLEVLRRRMTDRGVSGVKLAAAVGMGQPTFARKLAEKGARGGTFTLQQWDDLAHALDDDLEEMLERARQLLRQTGD